MNQRDTSAPAISSAIFGGETARKPVLTVAEVAALLQVSEDSVYRHRRELGGFRLGRSVRFRRDRVEAFTAASGGLQGAMERPRPASMSPLERKAWRAGLKALGKTEGGS